MTQSPSYRRILTRMGYYNYQNGLISRHLNQEDSWAYHLDQSRKFIIKAIELYSPEKITVLGSGWLLDFPMAELAERTGKIYLIDIVHPPDVIKQVSIFNNIELIEQDVTGGLIGEVWQRWSNYTFFSRPQTLKNLIVPDYKSAADPGMVISLNILTQLESLIIDFIRKRSKIKEEEINIFRTEIQKKHIDFLNKHKSVLISDYAEVITNRLGSITTIPTLLANLPPYQLKEEWTWKFDQTGEDLYNCKSQFKVFGLIN
jgi:hypothetical protein